MPKPLSFKQQQQKVQAAARAGRIHRARADHHGAEIIRHLGTPAGVATAFACGLLFGLGRRETQALPSHLKAAASLPLRYLTAGLLR